MAPPAEIYNRPADPFVANFTGASNVLLGKVLARSGDKATIDLGAAGRIEAWTPQPLAVGDKARVALRAENVRLGERGPANAFSGRVIERRYQGMQTVYDVELGGQRLEALELGTAARHNDGELPLTLPPDQCWAYRDEGASFGRVIQVFRTARGTRAVRKSMINTNQQADNGARRRGPRVVSLTTTTQRNPPMSKEQDNKAIVGRGSPSSGAIPGIPRSSTSSPPPTSCCNTPCMPRAAAART